MKRQNFLRGKRSSSAYALISTLILGLAAIAMMMALMPLLLTVMKSETASRSAEELLAAAEIGIDYGVQTLNQSPPGTASIDLSTSNVPPNYLAGFKDLTAKIRIRRLSPKDSQQGWDNFKAYSTIYSTSLDNQLSATASGVMTGRDYKLLPRNNIQSGDYWRVLECTATKGLFSRSVRVFLQPVYSLPAGEMSDYVPPSTAATTNSPYFKNSFFGNSAIEIAGPSSVSGTEGIQNSEYKLSLQSNQLANSGNNSKINGNIVVSNGILNAPTDLGINDGSATIAGELKTNSGVSDSYKGQPGLTPGPDDNILPDAAPRTAQTQPIQDNLNTPQLVTAPAPTDVSATPLSQFTGSELAGSYSTNGLVVQNSSNPINITQPVKLFVSDGVNLNPSAIDVPTSYLRNTTAGNLQIWYGGTRDIKLNLDRNFNATIYAPNAKVSLAGSSNFVGAIVANQIIMNNTGSVTIDTALQDLSSGSGASNGLTYATTIDQQGAVSEPLPLGYKAVTWQEFPRALF